MKVQVNNKEVELTTGNTISALAAQLDLPPQGVAIALNNRMIPRSQWAEQEIQADTSSSSPRGGMHRCNRGRDCQTLHTANG